MSLSPTPPAATAPPSAGAPDAAEATDLLLARAHLRIGMFAFARAELEALAVRGGLDVEGLSDLAEARWRTGDLPAAGQAAEAHLREGGATTTALVIAAEAAVADGRPADARRLADSALERAEDLEAIFAGLPRSRIWRPGSGHESATEVVPTARDGVEEPAPQPVQDEPARPASRPEDAVRQEEGATAVSPHQLIAFAAGALREDRGRAAVELSIVLRSEPSLAPAVLELLGKSPDPPASRSAAALEIVRGDAYRLIGRPREAEQAYGRAISMLSEPEGNPG